METDKLKYELQEEDKEGKSKNIKIVIRKVLYIIKFKIGVEYPN